MTTEFTSVGEIEGFCFKDYGYIGFDLDHTIVRYHIAATHQLIWDLLTAALVSQFDLPPLLFSPPQQQLDLAFAVKGTLLDTALGNVVLLDQHRRVFKAYHGWGKPQLSPFLLAKHYPEPVSLTDPRFFVLSTYFITTWAQIFALLVDDVDARSPAASWEANAAEYQTLKAMLFAVTGQQFASWSEGGYFRAVEKEPSRYLQPNNLRPWISELRRHSKVFLCTNSLPEYTELLLRWSFGEDWDTVFDLLVAVARKPHFFTEEDVLFEEWVYDRAGKTQVQRAKSLGTSTSEIRWGGHYSFGCAKLLVDNFRRLDGVADDARIRLLYAGDHIESDCLVPMQIVGNSVWETIAIVEEMEDLELDFPHISLHPKVAASSPSSSSSSLASSLGSPSSSLSSSSSSSSSSSPPSASEEAPRTNSNHRASNPYWSCFFRSPESLTFWGHTITKTSLSVPSLDRLALFSPAEPLKTNECSISIIQISNPQHE